MTSHVTMVQLEARGCGAELYLNDIPLRRIAGEPGDSPIANTAASPFLIGGRNRLELLVEPGPSPSEARYGTRELDHRPMLAAGRIIRFPLGVPARAEFGEVLAEVTFRWTTTPPERRRFPIVEATEYSATGRGRNWAWQDAPQLTLDDALIAEATAFMEEMSAAMRAFDADRVFELAAISVRERIDAMGVPTEAEARKELRDRLERLRHLGDPVALRDADRHDFRLVAGGKMLQLVDVDYGHSFGVRHPYEEGADPYRMMLGRTEHGLRILR